MNSKTYINNDQEFQVLHFLNESSITDLEEFSECSTEKIDGGAVLLLPLGGVFVRDDSHVIFIDGNPDNPKVLMFGSTQHTIPVKTFMALSPQEFQSFFVEKIES